MYEGKFIIASGPVIIEEGKLLVNKDGKDDFYKIPGGTIEKQESNLDQLQNNPDFNFAHSIFPLLNFSPLPISQSRYNATEEQLPTQPLAASTLQILPQCPVAPTFLVAEPIPFDSGFPLLQSAL